MTETTDTGSAVTLPGHSKFDFGEIADYFETMQEINALQHDPADPDFDSDTKIRIDMMVAGDDHRVDMVRGIALDMGVEFSGRATQWFGAYTHVIRLTGERGKTIDAFETAMEKLREYGDFDSAAHEFAPGFATTNEIFDNWIG